MFKENTCFGEKLNFLTYFCRRYQVCVKIISPGIIEVKTTWQALCEISK